MLSVLSSVLHMLTERFATFLFEFQVSHLFFAKVFLLDGNSLGELTLVSEFRGVECFIADFERDFFFGEITWVGGISLGELSLVSDSWKAECFITDILRDFFEDSGILSILSFVSLLLTVRLALFLSEFLVCFLNGLDLRLICCSDSSGTINLASLVKSNFSSFLFSTFFLVFLGFDFRMRFLDFSWNSRICSSFSDSSSASTTFSVCFFDSSFSIIDSLMTASSLSDKVWSNKSKSSSI